MLACRAFSRMPQIMMLLFLTVLIGCGRAPELIGIDNPEFPAASISSASSHKIFIATTRQKTETAGALFSSERSPELGLASVTVSVPPTHVTGELERPQRLPPDPRTEFAIVDPVIYASDQAFINSMDAQLSRLPRGEKDILFFVHGYNNTTSDAVLRLAQFVEDTGFDGIPVLFDWASAASISRYVYDLNSALIARPKIAEIAQIIGRTDADNYNIFAHSMGSLLTMEAMVQQSQKGLIDQLGRLRSITLASPDIDLDLFRSQLAQIDAEFDRFFVLLSKDDSALSFSRRIAGGVPRVGASEADELAALGIIAIDLSQIDDSSSGSHSKFAGSPEVVQLIGRGLNNNQQFDRSNRAATLGEVLRGVPVTVAFE